MNPVRKALFGKLAGDGTLDALLGTPPSGYRHSIFYEQAPQGASLPLVVFSKSSGVPTDTFGTPGALNSDVWLVKSIDRDSRGGTASGSSNVEDVSLRVQALLNDATLSISGADHLYLRRESDVDYAEVTQGESYRHCGSLYRLVYEPA
jgi:hypothetical protein